MFPSGLKRFYARTQVDAGKWTTSEEMIPLAQFGVLSALATALTSVLSALLLLVLTRQLWSLRWSLTRDKDSSLPLPNGSMGWPLVGETLHWLFQVREEEMTRLGCCGSFFTSVPKYSLPSCAFVRAFEYLCISSVMHLYAFPFRTARICHHKADKHRSLQDVLLIK